MKKWFCLCTVIAVLFSFIIISSALAQNGPIHYTVYNTDDVEVGSGILHIRDGSLWIVAHAINVDPECSCNLKIIISPLDPQQAPIQIDVFNMSTHGGTWHYHGFIEGMNPLITDDVWGNIHCLCVTPLP